MAYVPAQYKVSKERFNEIYNNAVDPSSVTWETLLMADYVYHHQDDDYNDGLSFLRRLEKKLGKFHPEWDVDGWCATVDACKYDSAEQFILIVKEMLEDPSDVAYYGL